MNALPNIPMTFMWPQFLWLLLVLPLLILIYIWLLRRKKKVALRYASLSIVREAMGKGQSFRRHIPPLLFLLSLAAMLVASSRPFAVVSLPSDQQTIMLAMDVSGSMRATDVKPNRLVASQDAAKAFLAGDLEGGLLLLDESSDNLSITGTWNAELVEGSCGRKFSGVWKDTSDNAPPDTPEVPFTLEKIPGW